MITVHFFLKFSSTFGQQFFVVGNHPALGNGDEKKAVAMQFFNNDYWGLTIDIDDALADEIHYKYILRHEDGFESMEWLNNRSFQPKMTRTAELQLIDNWNYSGYYQNAFYTQPFRETLGKRNSDDWENNDQPDATHVFRVMAPLLPDNQTVGLLGNVQQLGAWEAQETIWMQEKGDWFEVAIDLSEAQFPVDYKYVIVDKTTGKIKRWEEGVNRILFGIGKRQSNIVHDGFINLPHPNYRGAGVAIPVFSLRKNIGNGVGEFSDIMGLADWCDSVGIRLIQLLPINDTTSTHTWTDSYPYAPVSVFALHPLYIDLKKLASDKHLTLIATSIKKLETIDQSPVVDYESVMAAKWEAITILYPALKKSWLKDKAYLSFLEKNKNWLLPYAAFCHFRDEYGTADALQWKTNSVFDPLTIQKLFNTRSKNFDQVGIHLFVQWHLHLQLKEAVDYAHSKGIILKGDLPIGIYRYSCDAWMAPEQYNMDEQAGAPPDDFAVKGQNWGFPTYNWQRMQADDFSWWKKRFSQMSEYFDAFRIDHILGFFRIWSIPNHAVEGIMGHFEPSIPVLLSEFEDKGISFDLERFTQPYIVDGIVRELFGEQESEAKRIFLDAAGYGIYRLKKAFDTQKKTEQWFADNPDVPSWMKNKVFDLISNIILIPDDKDPGNRFHFRIVVDTTSSWRHLDQEVQEKLKALYIDYFFHRQNEFWREQAMQKLPQLKAATSMLVCGEDLGMVPDCVPGVMQDLGLLSLEIQRMPKAPNTRFFHPFDAPYLSVVTPSTHDMSTIRGWWEENQETSQQFYNNVLHQPGHAPFYCEPWINRTIIMQHMYSPAMWSIFQLQDLLGSDENLRRENPGDERINVPANPKHYWRYRMHISLENLESQSSFNGDLKAMIRGSGRS